MTFEFDDQDWDSGYSTPREARTGSTAWKVAAGVFIGAVLGGALVIAVERYLPQMAMSEAAQVFGAAMRGSSDRTPAEPAPPLRDSTAQEPEHRPLETQPKHAESAPPAAGVVAPTPPVVVDKRESDRGNATPAGVDRKAQAWNEYYKRPRHCVENPSADTLVECANHYIRARREFEAAYKAGAR